MDNTAVRSKPNTDGRIQPLQGLRGMAILAIVAFHVQIDYCGAMGFWGVSIFFIMSGFLMAYHYTDRNNKLGNSTHFMWSKVKRLYPLHIVTMMACIPLAIINCVQHVDNYNCGGVILDVILNVFLFEKCVPVFSIWGTLNGPSWFLGAIAFCYLLVPTIHKLFFARHFSRKLQNVFGECCISKLEKVAEAVPELSGCRTGHRIHSFLLSYNV